MLENKTKKSITMIAITIMAIVFALWLLAIYLGLSSEIKSYTSQPIADTFGGVNALFAGGALGGVILTIFLQISELQDTKEEMTEAAKINKAMSDANVKMSIHSDEKMILELFQTYCSEYFQFVKNSSMSVLIPCVASKEYYTFVISRFFVADQMSFPDDCWEKVSKVSRCKTLDEFKSNEQDYRYKLDELINFFTLLISVTNAKDIISRLDFSYSWWRPLLWLLAFGQEKRFNSSEQIQKYATPLYLKEVVTKLDNAYGLTPFNSEIEFLEFFTQHPKIKHYQLDDNYSKGKSL